MQFFEFLGRRNLKTVSLVCLFLDFFLGYGQNVPIRFNYQSGLSSDAVYAIADDNSGKIWITTDKGITSYDGTEFKRYGLEDGLPNLFSWNLKTDAVGRIWLFNRSTPFTYILNDSIHRVGEKYEDVFFEHILIQEDGSVYISSFKSNKTHKIDSENRITEYDSILVSINSLGQEHWTIRENLFNDTCWAVKYFFFQDLSFSYKKTITGGSYLEIEHSITHKKKIIPISSFTTRLEHLCPYDSNHVLLSCEDGLKLMNIHDFQIFPYSSDYNTTYRSVVSYHKDWQGNSWFADIKRGVIFSGYVPSEVEYRSLNFDHEEITNSFKDDAGVIHLCSNKPNHYEITKNGVHDHKRPPFVRSIYKTFYGTFQGKKVEHLYSPLYIGFGEAGTVKDTITLLYEVDKATRSFDEDILVDIGLQKSQCMLGNVLGVGTNRGCFTFIRDEDSLHMQRWVDGYCFGVFLDSLILYSVGTKGFYKIDLERNETTLVDGRTDFLDVFVTDEFIFVRNESASLFKFSKITLKLLEESSAFKDLQRIQYVDKEIWGLARDRLVRLDENFNVLLELNQLTGIAHPFKVSLEKSNSTYYLICSDGYYRFENPSSIMPNMDFKEAFGISRVLLDGTSISPEQVRFSSVSSTLEIHLNNTFFPFSESVQFYYRINDGPWNPSSSAKIMLINLPFGTHRLDIKTSVDNAENTHSLQTIYIHNSKPFYRVEFFWIIVVFILVAIIILRIRRIQTQKRQALKLQYDIIKNREKITSLALDPDFLSSLFKKIKQKIREGDLMDSSELTKEANAFLRKMLKASQMDCHSIAEEIDLLNIYLSLIKKILGKEISIEVNTSFYDEAQSIWVPVFILYHLFEIVLDLEQDANRNPLVLKLEILPGTESHELRIQYPEDMSIGTHELSRINEIKELLELFNQGAVKNHLQIEKMPTGMQVHIFLLNLAKEKKA